MIYGEYGKNFQIHIDKMITNGKWQYGAFNLVIDEIFYPGRNTFWTLNIIRDCLESFLEQDLLNFEMEDCEIKTPETLFKDAVISRIGYYYDNIDDVMTKDEISRKYPKKVGVHVQLFEIEDTGFDLFFFRGKHKDILVYSFDNKIFRTELDIGYFHKVILSAINESIELY